LKLVEVPSQGNMQLIVDYFNRTSDIFLLKYEDFVDRKLDDLEKYLQLDIRWNNEVPEKHKRVIRTKSYGGWKDWFTESDVEYFKTIYQDYFDIFNYGDDWQLSQNPNIDPETSSKYVQRLKEEAGGLQR
jgi:hypothetical protein